MPVSTVSTGRKERKQLAVYQVCYFEVYTAVLGGGQERKGKTMYPSTAVVVVAAVAAVSVVVWFGSFYPTSNGIRHTPCLYRFSDGIQHTQCLPILHPAVNGLCWREIPEGMYSVVLRDVSCDTIIYSSK